LIRDLSNQVAQYLGSLRGVLRGYDIIIEKFGKPDLVHCNVSLYAGLAALYIKMRYDIAYILTEHWSGYLDEDGSFKKRSLFGKAVIRAIGENAVAITTVSEKLGNAMVACGIKNEYFVIPNVVDKATLNCSKNIGGKVKQILHVSILKDNTKNVSGIIEAIRNLSLKRNDFELHIVGNGGDRERLEELSDKYGLLNKVIFFEGMVPADKVSIFFVSATFLYLIATMRPSLS